MTENTVEDSKPATQGKPPGLLKSSLVAGSMTFLSRILGLARDLVFARYIAIGTASDAFFLAFRITSFLRRLFAEGAFNQAFVPVLSEYRNLRSLSEVQTLVNYVAGSLGGSLLILTVIVVAVPQVLAYPMAYGFVDNPAQIDLLVDMLRVTFPYLLLVSMAAFSGAILNTYDRYAVPAFTPVLLNISLIVCAVFLSPVMEQPAMALAWGVLIAGVCQLGFQLPFLARLKLLPVPMIGKPHEGVQRIKKLMLPALFGVSVSQINLAVDTIIASFLIPGSITWLYYSERLVDLPLGIFGIAIATVVLPNLSRNHTENSMQEFSATLDWALRLVMMIAIPATAAFWIISEPILVTLFHNENFDVNVVMMVTRGMQAYALGLFAFMSIKILAPGFYSRQDTKTPVRIGVIAMVANMVLNYLLVFVLDLAHAGLLLATSLAAFLNAGLLLRALIKAGVFQFQPGWSRFVMRLGFSTTMLALSLNYLVDDWQMWIDWSRLTQVVRLAVLCIGGFLVYSISLYACGIRGKDLRR